MDPSYSVPLTHIVLRRNLDGLFFIGQDSSADIFPHLGVDWTDLQAAVKRSGLPIADVGSSFSSFPAEAELRGIPVVPIDIMRPHRKLDYASQLWDQLLELRTKGTISNETSSEEMNAALIAVKQRYLACDVAAIPLPDQAFSVVIAHDCVPKHSDSPEQFLTQQLPEILRVTHNFALIYPLEIHRANAKFEGELRLTVPFDQLNSSDQIAEVAERAGYSVRFLPVSTENRAAYCGVFTRDAALQKAPALGGEGIINEVVKLAWRDPPEEPNYEQTTSVDFAGLYFSNSDKKST